MATPGIVAGSASGPLTNKELEQLHRDGFVVVANVFDNASCQKFMEQELHIHLETYGNPREQKHFATGEYDPNKHTEIPGVMLRNPNGSDPLPDQRQEWILQNGKLVAILNQLHGGLDHWEWIHPQNVGWIHLRFPVTDASQFEPRWHVDGGHFTPHYLTSPEQSVIVLPILHEVDINSGSTLVLPESHHYMAQLLHSRGAQGLQKCVTQDCRPLGRIWPIDKRDVAPLHRRDVILLHPLVVHAAGFHTNLSSQQNRITFNMGTRWTRKLSLKQPSSWLEASLNRSLKEPTPTLKQLALSSSFKLHTPILGQGVPQNVMDAHDSFRNG
jgi:ectoine hydroxylase-related dioxygenase (phytanoyl-CoA dioxygenase family)